MRTRLWGCASGVASLGIFAWAAVAHGQEADASADMSFGSQGADASADAGAQGTAYPEIGEQSEVAEPASEPAPSPDELPYLKRYRPEANTWEMGVGATVYFPSPGLQLTADSAPYSAYDGVGVGPFARLGYYPLSFLGVEAETMFAKGGVGGGRAIFSSLRGNVVLQLPIWSIVPFVAGGLNGTSAASNALGHDTDFGGQFGAGLKVALSRNVALRGEFRENLSKRVNDAFAGVSFSEEVMLGLTFTLRPKQVLPPPPPPPADGDHDGVPDETDQCPAVGAFTVDGCPPDTDGDGVRDPEDECPRVAAQTETGCPDPDPDQDGIKLPCDLCPDEVGIAPDGCPIRDKDGDGILDDKDQCIDEPETKNGYEDEDGCPDEVPKEVEKFTGAIQGITFLRGSAKIARSSMGTLTRAADVLKKYPTVRLEISGHTSSEGDPDFNQKLSEERAESVRAWLIDVGRVDGSRLISRGAGFSEPVADNGTAAGREKNRRIEFKLLQAGDQGAADAGSAEAAEAAEAKSE